MCLDSNMHCSVVLTVFVSKGYLYKVMSFEPLLRGEAEVTVHTVRVALGRLVLLCKLAVDEMLGSASAFPAEFNGWREAAHGPGNLEGQGPSTEIDDLLLDGGERNSRRKRFQDCVDVYGRMTAH